MFLNVRLDVGKNAFGEVVDGLLIVIHVDGLYFANFLVRLDEREDLCFDGQLEFCFGLPSRTFVEHVEHTFDVAFRQRGVVGRREEPEFDEFSSMFGEPMGFGDIVEQPRFVNI